jgi:hypothetical protein
VDTAISRQINDAISLYPDGLGGEILRAADNSIKGRRNQTFGQSQRHLGAAKIFFCCVSWIGM